jgi:hypothetical protein
VFPSLFRLVCLASFRCFNLVCFASLTSVKWLPVCWDCKGSNLIYIVKLFIFLFFFLFIPFKEIRLPFPVNTKRDNLYSFISLSNLSSSILLTNPLPPKRSANVDKKSSPQNNYVKIVVPNG